MGLLLDWFGIGKGREIEALPRAIQAELALLEELLQDALEAENIDFTARKQLVKSILSKEARKISSVFVIEQKAEDAIEFLIARKHPDIKLVLFLQNLLRDLRSDPLWKELRVLWQKEYAVLEKGEFDKAAELLKEQKQIAQILKSITLQRFNETHMHFGMSVSPDTHWKYLKLLWKKAESTPGLQDELNIKTIFEKYSAKKQVFPGDAKSIAKIMHGYFGGRISEAEAFMQFEQLLIMPETDKGCFHDFNRKANILNAIQAAMSANESLRWKFFYDCMDSIAQHNLAHNITHIEIRFPAAGAEGLEFWAELCNAIEQKYKGKIIIRMVEFLIGDSTLEKFTSAYQSASPKARKYFVAVDPTSPVNRGAVAEISKYLKTCKLPVVVHAGENWSQKDYPEFTAVERIGRALKSVETALLFPNLHRIGHANILGADIAAQLKGAKPAIVSALVAKQNLLIQKIKKRGIIIEANPTSNVMIRGMTYAEHPILAFEEYNVPYAISTDDRVIFDTNLKKEFYRIARALNWDTKKVENACRMQRAALLR